MTNKISGGFMSQSQQGLLFLLFLPNPFACLWFRYIVHRDIGNLVNLFMHVTN